MRVVRKPNLKKHQDRISAANKLLYKLSEGLIEGIIKRTQRGKDKNNKPFRPYKKDSKGVSKYAEKKAKEHGTRTVNLTVTNNMLHAIDVKKLKNGVKLFFKDTDEAKKAFQNHRVYKRHFFALDDKQVKKIKKRLADYIVKVHEK